MRKYIFISLLALSLVACGNKEEVVIDAVSSAAVVGNGVAPETEEISASDGIIEELSESIEETETEANTESVEIVSKFDIATASEVVISGAELELLNPQLDIELDDSDDLTTKIFIDKYVLNGMEMAIVSINRYNYIPAYEEVVDSNGNPVSEEVLESLEAVYLESELEAETEEETTVAETEETNPVYETTTAYETSAPSETTEVETDAPIPETYITVYHQEVTELVSQKYYELRATDNMEGLMTLHGLAAEDNPEEGYEAYNGLRLSYTSYGDNIVYSWEEKGNYYCIISKKSNMEDTNYSEIIHQLVDSVI